MEKGLVWYTIILFLNQLRAQWQIYRKCLASQSELLPVVITYLQIGTEANTNLKTDLNLSQY